MKKEIPWIGYCNDDMRASEFILRGLEKRGYKIIAMQTPSDGLIQLGRESYPKIIVSDRLPAGEMKFPAGINHFLYPVQFTRYVIESIRELPNYRHSPIIVPHFLLAEDQKILRIDERVELVDLFNQKSALEEILEIMDVTSLHTSP